jgi:hypothetical protein
MRKKGLTKRVHMSPALQLCPCLRRRTKIVLCLNIRSAPLLLLRNRPALHIRRNNIVSAVRRRTRVSVTGTIDDEHAGSSEELRHLARRAHRRNGVANSVDEKDGSAGSDGFEAWKVLAWGWDDVGCETDDTRTSTLANHLCMNMQE